MGLADVISIHNIELTNQIEYPEPGYLLTVHSQVDGSMCMLKITARPFFRFWQIVEAKSKTMDFWVRRRPLLSTYPKISGCLSSLILEKLFLSGQKTIISGFLDSISGR